MGGARFGLHGNADRIISHVSRGFFLLRANSEQKYIFLDKALILARVLE